MQLTERQRHDAYEALAETFGPKTDIVIAMLQPASDLVTKDVMAAGMADLRAEMADLGAELKTEMADLRTELTTEMADLRTDVKSEISTAIQAQTRTMMFTIMGAVVLVLLANALQTAFG